MTVKQVLIEFEKKIRDAHRKEMKERAFWARMNMLSSLRIHFKDNKEVKEFLDQYAKDHFKRHGIDEPRFDF
jgi:transcription elongation factor GreA-like protein